MTFLMSMVTTIMIANGTKRDCVANGTKRDHDPDPGLGPDPPPELEPDPH